MLENFNISAPDKGVQSKLQRKIDLKTKPLGALGALEKLALQIGTVQQSLSPTLQKPHLLVFAADHGIANDGVSAYPQEVTYQMVLNFVAGGAAINVFTRQHNIKLMVVDAGVNHNFDDIPEIEHSKIGFGTKSFLHQPAMTDEQLRKCVEKGAVFTDKAHKKGCNVIGFGEMGIGNSSSASVLMSLLLDIPIAECVGRGTGVNDEKLHAKIAVLQKSIEKRHQKNDESLSIMAAYGGFEIMMMCGAMLQAAANKMLVLVDGFIATSAYLCAYKLNPLVKEYAIFCHQSSEKGHQLMLEKLEAKPLIDMGMRLGEGTGCAIAYPLLISAVAFLNDMASFESANVSKG